MKQLGWITGVGWALLCGASAAGAQTPGQAKGWPEDSVAVRAALSRFLTAFENLDWPTFEASFDPEASAFFPVPEPQERADGRAAVAARFRRVFDEIRASAPSGPPFMRLAPENLRVEPLGPGYALVSFELHNSQRIARRTFVLRRSPGGWVIVHLHASSTPVSPGGHP